MQEENKELEQVTMPPNELVTSLGYPQCDQCGRANISCQCHVQAEINYKELLKLRDDEIERGLTMAESQHNAEKMGGNKHKEEYWKGECAVYHRLRHQAQADIMTMQNRDVTKNITEQALEQIQDKQNVPNRNGDCFDWKSMRSPENPRQMREHFSEMRKFR